MSDHRLAATFRPASIAVVGASPKGGYGLTTLENLRGVGYTGDVYVVHPREREVAGIKAYPSLRELPTVPDAVAIAVPAARVPQVVRDAAETGVRGGVVYASGFAELDDEGRALQKQIRGLCASSQLRLVGPNCLGVIGYSAQAALWGITMPFEHANRNGTVALAAQSGNMALTVLHSGRLPAVAYAASAGNQADVDVCDLIEFYLTDPGIRVICLILEGLGDLGRMRGLAEQALARSVGIVALKIGRSDPGRRAALAHTGTLVGDDGAYSAVFDQCGVISVRDLEEMIAHAALFAAPRRPRGTRLGAFASSGGECGLLSDLAEDVGLEVPALAPHTSERLADLLPAYGSVGNPFDLTAGGWGQESVYCHAARAIGADPATDAVVFVGDAPELSGDVTKIGWPEMVGGAAKAAADLDVPVALMTTTTDVQPALVRLCERANVPLLAGTGPGMRALAAVGRWAEHAGRPRDHRTVEPAAQSCNVSNLLTDQSGPLSESRSKAVLATCGIAVPDGADAETAAAATELAESIGYPVAVKLDAVNVAHKSDIGGVRLGLRTGDEVAAAYREVIENAIVQRPDLEVRGVRVEEMTTSDGVEMVVGAIRDPIAGVVVVVGAGGMLTELLADVARFAWPFDEDTVLRGIARLRVARLLNGFRGSPPADVCGLAEVAVALGRLCAGHDRIAEVEINPLHVTVDGCIAMDALVVAVPATPPSPTREEE